MKEIFTKLSSYNIFNYLFPGVIYSIIVAKITKYNLIIDNIFIAFFVYYFIGLIISRIGSLIIEPFLKKISFVVFANYRDFVIASKEDNKIEILSEINNMYRTIISLSFSLIITLAFNDLFEKYISQFECIHSVYYIGLIILMILFMFSYKKQTDYIRKRVSAIIDKMSITKRST